MRIKLVRLSSNELYVRKIQAGFLINRIYDIKLICKFYLKYMNRKLFNLKNKGPYSFIGLDKKIALAIQNHFRLSNYQMLVLCWFKGLWTGILLSLVLHYFISH